MDVPIPCLCPPKDEGPRHEGDIVTLRDTLDFTAAKSINAMVNFVESDDDLGGRSAETLARLSEGYILFGITAWTLRDEKDRPLPVVHSNVRSRILANFDVAGIVADAADELYHKAILLPLLRKASRYSPPTPINGSTSAQIGSPVKPPKRSKRSSTSTTQTVATETTSQSLDGDSSISPKSESAA